MNHPVTLSSGLHPTLARRRKQWWLVASLHLLTVLLLALHLYVRILPPTPTAMPEADTAEAAWWGLWPATYAPAWAVLMATLLIIGWITIWWAKALTTSYELRVTSYGSRGCPLGAQHATRNTQHATRNTHH